MDSDKQTRGALPHRNAGSPRAATRGGRIKKEALFERVTARLKAQVGPEVFTSWFGRLKLQSASKSVVRLSVPTAFLKSWINNKYLEHITRCSRKRTRISFKVEIVVRSATRAAGSSNAAVKSSPAAPQPCQQAAAKAAGKDRHPPFKGAAPISRHSRKASRPPIR